MKLAIVVTLVCLVALGLTSQTPLFSSGKDSGQDIRQSMSEYFDMVKGDTVFVDQDGLFIVSEIHKDFLILEISPDWRRLIPYSAIRYIDEMDRFSQIKLR